MACCALLVIGSTCFASCGVESEDARATAVDEADSRVAGVAPPSRRASELLTICFISHTIQQARTTCLPQKAGSQPISKHWKISLFRRVLATIVQRSFVGRSLHTHTLRFHICNACVCRLTRRWDETRTNGNDRSTRVQRPFNDRLTDDRDGGSSRPCNRRLSSSGTAAVPCERFGRFSSRIVSSTASLLKRSNRLRHSRKTRTRLVVSSFGNSPRGMASDRAQPHK